MRLYNPLNAYLNDEKKIISARVSQIDVSKDGLKHTRPFVITRAFNQLEKVTNLGELQTAIQEGLLRSEELGLFTSVIVSLDKDEEAIANGVSDAVRVVVRCDESEHRKKYRIGTSFTTQGEGKAEIGFTHTNFFGLGDREEVDLNIGRYKDLSFVGRLKFPQVFNGSGNLTLGAYLFGVKHITDLLKEKAHGISITNEITKRHSIAYELEWRNLMDAHNGPKDADDHEERSTDQSKKRSNLWTQSSSNASIKSAITHVYRHDGRDDVIDPSRGYFFRAATTIAGLGGDTRYVREQVDASVFLPLFKRFLVAAVDVSVGALKPLGDQTNVSLSDRFFNQMRGYAIVGDHDTETLEAHGGNVKTNVTARIILRIAALDRFLKSISSSLNIHFHTFANAAQVSNMDLNNTDYKQQAESWLKTLQASYGIGFVLSLFFGRFEFNYSQPYIVQGSTISDSHRKNFNQFGIHFAYNL